MGRQYSSKDFFRQMPNALLARYFHARGLFTDLDFAAMKETRPDALFTAWLSLPSVQRNAMDAEFQEIFELSCEKGFRAILDEAHWHLVLAGRDENAFHALTTELAALPSHFERAMVVFLDHGSFWKGAHRFFHADTLAHWRKRGHLPHLPAAVDEASLQALADMIRTYFHQNEGRGNNCTVEPFRRGELDYYFAYPEDYSTQSIEWVNGEFNQRPHTPAFEVIYVYSQKDGTLDMNFRGSYKAVGPLQQMFAVAILKLDGLPPDPKHGRVYDLNPLRRRSFGFAFDAESGILDVVVRKLRLSSIATKGDRITLEADTTHNRHAVYDLLDEIAKTLPMYMFNVTQVELAASVVTNPLKPPKTVSIKITHPDSCSLKYDELDLRLRQMLHASGIEPKDAIQPAPPAVDDGQSDA